MKNSRHSFFKRTASFVAATVMLAYSLPMQYVADGTKWLADAWSNVLVAFAANETGQLQSFSSIDDFKNYCINYTSANINDTIVLNFTDSQADIDDPNFLGLGSESAPFNGTVYISQYGGAGYTFRLDQPFFNCVTDSVQVKQYIQVIDGEGNPVPDPNASAIELTLVRIHQDYIAPLFANKVFHEAGGAVWKVKSYWYQDDTNPGVHDFGDVIFEIGSNVSISLDYDNSATDGTKWAKTVSTGDAGMVCGTMGAGSKISLTLKGSNTHNDISTTNGYAGGLVGSMASGSELEITSIDSTYTNAFNSTARTITGSKSAGGLVGKCVDAKVTFPASYKFTLPTNSVITGSEATGASVAKSDQCAGGLFGYYETGANSLNQFDLKDYFIDCKVSAYNSGGVFGALKTTNHFTIDGTPAIGGTTDVIKVEKINTVGEFGGIAGYYCTTALANNVIVSNAEVETRAGTTDTYGGVFGWMDATNVACYLDVTGFNHTTKSGYASVTNNKFGGVIGSVTGKNSLLNIGSIELVLPAKSGDTVYKFKGGGIVGNLGAGVLRLSGTTNLTAATATGGVNSGQLVGDRGNTTLVYAIGNGKNYNSTTGTGWTFQRSTNASSADDIGRWGSVVRIANIEGNALTYNGTNHTVTVDVAVSSMSTPMQFVKTALNMQLYNGTSSDALIFNNANVLSEAYSITASINLSGTGIGGFMKDGSATDADVGSFTGSLSGTGSVSLAIGETYGDSISSSSDSGEGKGQIYYHKYNGLFSRTGTATNTDVVEISNVAIDGFINVKSSIQNTYIGGMVALVNNGIKLTDTASSETINLNCKTNSGNRYVGGLIGAVGSSNEKSVTIEGTSSVTLAPSINTSGKLVSSDAVGGAIGLINSVNEFDVNVTNVLLAANISSAAETDSCKDRNVGCLIADIVSNSGSDTRTVKLTNLDVDGTTLTCTNANTSCGGILGYTWMNTNVVMDAVALSNDNTIVTNSSKFAGLVYKATGHWEIESEGLHIEGLDADNQTPSEFAVIVLYGSSEGNGIYLEMKATDSYVLDDGLEIPAPSSLYDELVGYTGYNINTTYDVQKNGSGVISYAIGEAQSMSSSKCNTYQNRYNYPHDDITTNKVNNGKSRYYYNITSMNGGNDCEKLMLWSLYHYAASNIQHCFISSFVKADSADEITGTFNLEGYSYYPIDIDFTNGVKLDDVTIQFYNDGIEAAETSSSGNTDTVNRTTRSNTTQHYMMHGGLFRNVSALLRTTGNIHFKGNVCADVTYSGVLVNGTVTGSVITSSSKEIVLEGIELKGTANYLLINKVADDSNNVNAKKEITISGVRTGGGKNYNNDVTSDETAYGNNTYAKSLIGDVTGHNVQLTFSRMKLDARKTAGTTYSDLDAIYGTSKSIFSQATLLNSFQVDSASSSGIYNYKVEEDWVTISGTKTHKGNVTYGKEIIDSVEYRENNVSRENKYIDSDEIFTYPKDVTNAGSSAFSAFSSDFRPYVYDSVATNSSHTTYHEIKVNVKTSNILYGCGTYDHPYNISTAKELKTVADLLNGQALTQGMQIRLPIAPVSDESYSHWCGGEEVTEDGKTTWNFTGCDLFTVQSDLTLKNSNGTTSTWNQAAIQDYLAGAYYQITDSFTLESNYLGLGNVTATSSDKTPIRYAFRGVIVGEKNDDGTPKHSITIKTKCTATTGGNYNTYGLIAISNGSVVKDLKIIVDTPTTDNYNYRSYVNKAYDYNAEFPNYGAVINKIMGGDNVIDNVTVEYKSTFKIEENNDYKATVGGYVGAVVNGGLVFRNVKDASLKGFAVNRVNASGEVKTVNVGEESFTNLTDGGDTSHLYVNPFVGRVINGYAFRETTDDPTTAAKENGYRISENGKYGNGKTRSGVTEVTMHNTAKNYSIPDIDKDSTTKLLFDNWASVKIPDSQSMYIMSIITQSGAGSAATSDGDYQYSIGYDGTKERAYAGNSTSTYKTTRWALYDLVGNTHDITTSDYADKASKDTIGSKTAIPYVIYQYTTSKTNNDGEICYPARSLTGRTFDVALSGDGPYYLPDCFRGIGFIGENDKVNALNDNMEIYGFNGNGKIIDMNSVCHYYQRGDDPYFTFTGKNESNQTSGIALFCRVKQIAQSGTAYSSSSRYQIGNFNLQGFISGESMYDNGNVVNDILGTKTYTDFDKGRIDKYYEARTLHTAGVVSYATSETYFNFNAINFNSLEIRASGNVGAIMSRADSGSFYVNNCNANGLTLQGSERVGGFIGSIDAGAMHVNTQVDGASTLMTNVTFHNTTLDTNDNAQYGLSGGILGTYFGTGSINNNGSQGSIVIHNVTVEGGESNSHIGSTDNQGYAGGIIGYVNQVSGCLIHDCKVKEVSLTGKLAGGIAGTVGKPEGSNASNVNIIDCSVEGKIQGGVPQYSITCTQAAGGLVGFFELNSTTNAKYNNITYSMNIDGCTVKDYKIEETGNATGSGAGGIIGVQRNKKNKDRKLTIVNTAVNNCTIVCNGSSNNIGMSGGVGYVYKDTNPCYMLGYNLVVRNNTFDNNVFSSNNGNIAPYGNLVGRSAGSMNVQIVGYTVDNNHILTAFGSNSKTHDHDRLVEFDTGRLYTESTSNVMLSNYFNTTDSYIVYADFNHTCFDMTDSTADVSSLTDYNSSGNGSGAVANPDASSYVTVSPKTAMGSTVFLTSDGAYVYVNGTTKIPMAKVIADNTTVGKKYDNVPSADITAISNAGDPNTTQANKISTYQTEMGLPSNSVTDFPIVVINSTAYQDSTDLINQYIRTLTNTTDDYAANTGVSSRFIVKIYPCTFPTNGTDYVINVSGKIAGLQRNSTQMYMDKLPGGSEVWADSNQEDSQFSLVDVQYLDPTDATKVAYHLYVPVLTRKMMKSNFKSAALQGTDTKAVSYTNKFGDLIAESLDAWFTNYIVFQYPTTEINTLLEGGDDLQWTNKKAIRLNYTTTNGDGARKLGDATKILLIDPNKGDEVYYSTFRQMRADGNAYLTEDIDTLNFTNFYSDYGDIDGQTYKAGKGTQFVQSNYVTLAELAEGKLTAVTTGDKKHYKQLGTNEEAAEGATVFTIGTDRYQYVTDSSGTHNIVINADLEEAYYIGFSAANASMMYKFDINCPPVLDGNTKCQVTRPSNQVANAILGNVYLQAVSIDVKNNDTLNELIDDENNKLNISLETVVSLGGSEADKQFIVNNIAPNQSANSEGIPLYQAFIISLSAHDHDGNTRKQIAGNPMVTGSITTPDGVNTIPVQYPSGTYIMLPAYDIHNKLVSASSTVSISANLDIDYSNTAARNSEFPSRPLNYNQAEYGAVGVNVSAVSNLSYENSEAKLLSTKMCYEPVAPDEKYFYINELDKATLVYNATPKIDIYDKDGYDTNNRSQLGLNPRNAINPNLTQIPIESVATYNASKVKNVNNAKYVRYTLKLEQKTGGATDATYKQVAFNDFFIGNIELSGMNMVTSPTAMLDTTMTATDGKTLYYYGEIKTDQNVEEGDTDTLVNSITKEFNVNINFTVKTGGDFTKYSNYRVRLIAELMTDRNNENSILAQSKGEDWIVYTNAKINPSMITRTNNTP